MKVLVLSITHRTLGNIAPVLRVLQRRGADIQLIWCPTTQPLDQGPQDYGLSAALISPFVKGARTPPRTHKFWTAVSNFVEAFRPDVIVSDDMTTMPVRFLRSVLDEMPKRAPVVAFQHGLYQNWYDISENFAADAFLCFGARHVTCFPVEQWSKVLPVGLPKLDALRTVQTTKEGFVAYFAQPHPDPSIIVRMAVDLVKRLNMPVMIRPHPQSPQAYGAVGSLLGEGVTVSSTEGDPIDFLRRCNVFVTTHSTAVLEAILLNKPTVVMPSHGLTDFGGFPHVACDFTAFDCERGLRAFERGSAQYHRFVETMCGGGRCNSTQRAVGAIVAIAEAGGALPSQWWKSPAPELADIADLHPLRLASQCAEQEMVTCR